MFFYVFNKDKNLYEKSGGGVSTICNCSAAFQYSITGTGLVGFNAIQYAWLKEIRSFTFSLSAFSVFVSSISLMQ